MSKTAGKSITCKAAIAWEPKKPLTIETIEVAPPKKGEVRVKIISTGVCHSDESARVGYDPNTPWPCILGHEGSGIVESIGEGVTVVEPGDHVIPLYMAQCYECKSCKGTKTNLCDKLWMTQSKGVMPDGTTRFTCNGKPVYHFMGTSTFSEYTVVTDISICKVNKDAPLEKICLIGCGIPTGYGAALNTAKVEKGSTCAVWGLGAIGMSVLMGCKAAGASKIYGIDINPDKAEMAKKFGMTDFINPKDFDKPLQLVLMGMTGGGLDYTFEAIGNVETMNTAFESLGKGGVAVVIGLAPAGQKISTQPLQMVLGKTWKGTAFGGWKSRDDVPKLVEKYMNKELMVDEFITHTLTLDKINEAFDLMIGGKSLRSVVNM